MEATEAQAGQPVTVHLPVTGLHFAGDITTAHRNTPDAPSNGILRIRVTDPGNTRRKRGDEVDVSANACTLAYDATIPRDGGDDATYQEHRRERSTDVLTWHSAGTDEPGDQQADAGIVRGYWLIGPDGDGWSLSLIEQNDALEEVFSWAWPAVDELHAKSIAESAEKFGQAPPKE